MRRLYGLENGVAALLNAEAVVGAEEFAARKRSSSGVRACPEALDGLDGLGMSTVSRCSMVSSGVPQPTGGGSARGNGGSTGGATAALLGVAEPQTGVRRRGTTMDDDEVTV